MKRGAFPAICYGRAGGSLRLRRPVAVLRAVLLDAPGSDASRARSIRCGTLLIRDPHPIAALCRAPTQAGQPDIALLANWSDRTPAAFVASTTESGWSPERLTP